MADNTQNPTTDPSETKMVRAISSFLVNHATGLILSFIIASGTTASLVILHDKIDDVADAQADVISEVKRTLEKYPNRQEIETLIIPHLDRLEYMIERNAAKNSQDLESFREQIATIYSNVLRLDGEVTNSFVLAENDRRGLRESVGDRLVNAKERIKDAIDHHGERISSKQDANKNEIVEEIRSLPDKLNSFQSAFVGILNSLARDGAVLIRRGDSESVGEWMRRVNYVLRSLPLPAEDGLFLNRSLVERELRKAISEYEKAENFEAAIEHAKETLRIVEAVTSLAKSGRIP